MIWVITESLCSLASEKQDLLKTTDDLLNVNTGLVNLLLSDKLYDDFSFLCFTVNDWTSC